LWLLVMGWVCASMPPATRIAAVDWIANARTFAHQGRLTLDVARLLTGEHEAPVVERTTRPAAPRSQPLVPIEFCGKKLELTCEGMAAVVPPVWRPNRQFSWAPAIPESLRTAPPHRPPRAGGRHV
jgi:hypothetical protein